MRKLFLSFICFFLIVTQVQSFNLTGLTGGYRLVKSGTVTAANTQLSLVDGTAFACFSGVDLSAYQTGKHLICVYNQSTGLLIASGYCSATAPSGETLGADALSGWDFTSEWIEALSTIIDSDSFSTFGIGGVRTSSGILSGGVLYKRTFERNTTASACIFITRGTDSLNPNDSGISSGSDYIVGEATYNRVYVRNAGGGTTDVTSMKVEPVTDCAATGVQIVNSKGGATQNWLKTGSGALNANINYKIYFVGD